MAARTLRASALGEPSTTAIMRVSPRVAEATIRHVWDQLEPPSVDEGFVDIVEVGAVG